MTHVQSLVNSVFGQIQLALMHKQHKHHIGVYIAKQNLTPVIAELCHKAGLVLMLKVTSLKELEEALWNHYKIRIDVWQKPDAFPDRNHLTLTVGSLTAIIFDYEETIHGGP